MRCRSLRIRSIVCFIALPVYDCDFKIKFGKPNTTAKNLKITIPENLDYEGIFDEIIKKYSKDYTLQKVRTTDLGSLYELTYSVNMNKDADEKKFIDELRCRNGNLNIVLSLAATELYGK